MESKELIEKLAKAHDLNSEDMMRVIINYGLIGLWKDMEDIGNLKDFNAMLKSALK